jgi:hypothetical protein
MVRGLIADPAARLSVAIETGPDEAILVGTADAFLRMALTALEFVADAQAGRATQLAVGSVTVADTGAFAEVIKSGEVGLSGGWLVVSAEEAQAVAEHILWLSPPPSAQ